MFKPLIALMVFLFVFAFAGFAGAQDSLDGSQWQLVSYGGTPVLEDSTITLEFGEDNRAVGLGGCNNYGSTYTVEDDAISFSEVISTRMACLSDDLMAQETAYFEALAAATRYELSGDQLIIEYGDGEQLVFARASSLSGTAWQLVSYGEETPVIGETPITLEFGEDNSAVGSGGCNSYGSTYEVVDDTIQFEQVATTERACLDEGVMAQEQAYYEALGSTSRYELSGDQLIIEYGDGEQLVFERVESLSGTAWQLVSFAGTPAVSEMPVTLEFGEDNRVAGSGGCNSYGGGYTVEGNTIRFAEVVSTLMMCNGEMVMAQETAYFEALSTPATYMIDGDTLTIETEEGVQLVFTRAASEVE